jgi:hypothetical protein
MQAKVKSGTAQPVVITANRLLDGRVVWLGDGGGWTEHARAARVFSGPTADAALMAGAEAEARQEIVGPYAVLVAQTEDGPWPVSMRERIRAIGPSIQAGIAA